VEPTDRMVQLVGESAYVRWMDDQCMGVRSRAEGLRVLAEVGISLSTLLLTPNAKKSKARVSLRFDAVAGLKYMDMRTLLTLRLLQLNQTAIVRSWVARCRCLLPRDGGSAGGPGHAAPGAFR
jgi:hypothetical protein